MGFFDNLIGNGSSSQNKYQVAANNERNAYRDAANTALAPFAGSGVLAQDITNRLNGINGGDAQRAQFAAFQASPLAQKMGVGGDYTTSPGYQWQLGQGLNAIDSSAASKGLLGSGATLKAEQEYGQGLAAQDYGNWVSRLGSVYGDYLGGLGGTANTGANAVNAQANNILTAGGANANGVAQIGANKTAGATGLAGLIAGGLGSAGSIAKQLPVGY